MLHLLPGIPVIVSAFLFHSSLLHLPLPHEFSSSSLLLPTRVVFYLLQRTLAAHTVEFSSCERSSHDSEEEEEEEEEEDNMSYVMNCDSYEYTGFVRISQADRASLEKAPRWAKIWSKRFQT